MFTPQYLRLLPPSRNPACRCDGLWPRPHRERGLHAETDSIHCLLLRDGAGDGKALFVKNDQVKFFYKVKVAAVVSVPIGNTAYAHGSIHPVVHPMYMELATTRSTQKCLKAIINRRFGAAYPA